jgi:hypothetical protein
MYLTRTNHRVWMITFYCIFTAIFLYIRPSVAFGRDGGVRPFGATEKEASVFPVWWWIFMIAVLSYCVTVAFAGFHFDS